MQYANLVGDYHLPGGTKSRLNEWYNLNALAVPAPFTYGNFRRNRQLYGRISFQASLLYWKKTA